MRALALSIVAILSLSASQALAHHKPGHSPPGHQKHNKARVVAPVVIGGDIVHNRILLHQSTFPTVELTIDGTLVQVAPPEEVPDGDQALAGKAGFTGDLGWRTYRDTNYNFEVDLPFGMFEPSEEAGRGIRLREIDGLGLLDVYGAPNENGLSPQDFSALLEGDDQIGEITYRASGQNWFVLSGYYSREGVSGEDLIFYAKFMFTPDHSYLSAFEVSYPLSEKRRFEPIVERLERTLSPPL